MAVMGHEQNPSWFQDTTLNRPVEEVTWAMCAEFAARLCGLEKLPRGNYRLPSEEEREYACRAGTRTPYCCSGSWQDLRRYADYAQTQPKGTRLVGRRRPNAWGICDMRGNVWEWCANDFYDYLEPADVDAVRKSIRGGNWLADYSNCRFASRYRLPPDSHGNMCGFRLVRSVPPSMLRPTERPNE